MKTFTIYLCVCFCIPLWAQNWTTNGSTHSFIENKGQFNNRHRLNTPILYAADEQNAQIYFTTQGLSFRLEKKEKLKENEWIMANAVAENHTEFEREHSFTYQARVIQAHWVGANPMCQVVATEPTADKHTYLVKNGQVTEEITAVKGFKTLTYKNVYPNVDAIYQFHPQEGIKYALKVYPGADVSQIKLSYLGADSLSIDALGNFRAKTLFGDIVDHAPTTFYEDTPHQTISSHFVLQGNTLSFDLAGYDTQKTIVIDPWTTAPGFGNSNRIWEVERDNANNVYIYGGDSPMRLRKYNATGTLQWTYNSTWDTSGYWVGTMICNPNTGNCYITSGSNGEVRNVSTAGASVWFNNPNGLFGPLFEYWHFSFNCDYTQLVIGGMRAPNPFSIGNYRGALMNLNLASGAVLGFTPVGYVAGLNIKEVRALCTAPTGNYYYLTLDSIGCYTTAFTMLYRGPSGYNFAYGIPNFGVTNQGVNAMRANANFIYTTTGANVHKRDITTGAIIATAAVPGGSTSTVLGSQTPNNCGVAVDNCGNVYVGAINQVVKFDANLNVLGTAAVASATYDVEVNGNGEVIACGNNFVASISSLTPCAPLVITCPALPLSDINVQVSSQLTQVQLKWKSASEMNVDYFEVERVVHGENPETIGVQDALGNEHNYVLNDLKPLSGESYYRLKLINYDGKHTYTEWQQVNRPLQDVFAVSPNPSEFQFFVAYTAYNQEPITMEVVDMLGKVVYTKKLGKVNIGIVNFEFELEEEVPAGVYAMLVKQGTQQRVLKIVKE